ncbi:MAG: hypothetical protein KDE20_24450, partial [Caldilineaceae bacterium]|nr:hypothetical protein [Caldilineaceae bacterium]
VSTKQPKIASLNPIVFPDKRRVLMELAVENLPTRSANVLLDIPGAPKPGSSPSGPVSPPSPYPNIELAIIDSRGKTAAATFIVEHQEPLVHLTLHLRQPDMAEQYVARAEMIYREDVLQVVEVPFTLAEAE